MRAAAICVLLLLRPTMARFAPRAASASAAAKPMPLVAPVIRICLPFIAQHSDISEPGGCLPKCGDHDGNAITVPPAFRPAIGLRSKGSELIWQSSYRKLSCIAPASFRNILGAG